MLPIIARRVMFIAVLLQYANRASTIVQTQDAVAAPRLSLSQTRSFRYGPALRARRLCLYSMAGSMSRKAFDSAIYSAIGLLAAVAAVLLSYTALAGQFDNNVEDWLPP